jgi:CheY-like chemotaxis protein
MSFTDMATGRPLEILLVEDNPADARLTEEALREGRVCNRLHHARDGVEAMEFLRGEGAYADAPTPDLILLDLNMPRKNGHEVLAELKEDARLRRTPVVVLTTSEAAGDIVRTYDSHVNCYICKPVELDKFLDIVRMVEAFWLTAVKLPSRDGTALH